MSIEIMAVGIMVGWSVMWGLIVGAGAIIEWLSDHLF